MLGGRYYPMGVFTPVYPKYMCEKFCGICANIAAQIASKTHRIRAHRCPMKFIQNPQTVCP